MEAELEQAGLERAGLEQAGLDPSLRVARLAVGAAAGLAWLSCLVIPAVAVADEPSGQRFWLGLAGLALVACTHGAVLWPLQRATIRPRWTVTFVVASAVSVPLLAPVGPHEWYTWSWIGGSVAGLAPLVVRRWWLPAALIVIVTASAAVGAGYADDALGYAAISSGVGAMVAGSTLLPVWLWRLLSQARSGRAAQARLAVTEERLRFARDVHDLLGHRLAIIALKAELAARLAAVDPDRSAQESVEVQQLSATALTEVREAVRGYRAIDLAAQLSAVEDVLRSAGIRCKVTGSPEGIEPDTATQLALVLREGCTNLLRHSKAKWCTIELSQDAAEVRLRMCNDGARPAAQQEPAERVPPDRQGFGLRGAAERLLQVGGTLRTRFDGDTFALDVSLPAAP